MAAKLKLKWQFSPFIYVIHLHFPRFLFCPFQFETVDLLHVGMFCKNWNYFFPQKVSIYQIFMLNLSALRTNIIKTENRFSVFKYINRLCFWLKRQSNILLWWFSWIPFPDYRSFTVPVLYLMENSKIRLMSFCW